MEATPRIHVVLVALMALCGLLAVGAFSSVGSDITLEGKLVEVHHGCRG